MTQAPQPDDKHKDPSHWKWGLFYYNKNDERLFVPKKNPNFGVTVNFANRYALLVFSPALMIIVLAVLVSLLKN